MALYQVDDCALYLASPLQGERDRLYAGCEVLVSDDGGCERDAEVCLVQTYGTFVPRGHAQGLFRGEASTSSRLR